MLPLEAIDLDTLETALDFQFMDSDTFFWLDADTGEVILWGEEAADEAETEGWSLDDRNAIRIDPLEAWVTRQDMEDFAADTPDADCRARLQHALRGHSRPIRRFKDVLYSFPDQQRAWYELHEILMQQRAIRWLVDEGVVDAGEADAAISRIVEGR